jgi:U3 small nucleolar RNA-associated protein 14
LADLLGAATANTNGNSDGAKAVKRLKGMKQDARGSGPTAKLSAPLAEHQQEHADRLVAYEKSQEDVTKWQPIVRRNRQAEQLSFPLAAGADGVGAGNQGVATASTTNALATKFEASTSLERDLDSIMKQYGMDEQDIVRAQQLEMRKLDPEEVKRREAELARMRSVLFYHELKLKRVAKIKSKTFRKIRKRQAERNGEEGSDDEVEGSKAEQLKAEIERAKERMTLKHNNTSKWAKHVLSRGAHKDEDQKKALAEQLRKGQQLRRKMNRLDDDDDDDVDDIDSDELDDSDDLDASGSESDGSDANIDNDQQLIRDPSELAEKEAEPTTGLFALKFMKRGAEKRQKAASALLAELDAQEKEEREFAKDNGQGAISKKFAGKQSAVARADDAATKWLNDTADADADDWVLNNCIFTKYIFHLTLTCVSIFQGAENMDGDDEEQQAAMRDAAQKKELEEAKLKSADHRAREQASGRRTFNANGARSSDVVQGIHAFFQFHFLSFKTHSPQIQARLNCCRTLCKQPLLACLPAPKHECRHLSKSIPPT